MELEFKTNIRNMSDVQTVSPFLEDEKGILYWHIAPELADNVLTLKMKSLDADAIISILRKAGYTAGLIEQRVKV